MRPFLPKLLWVMVFTIVIRIELTQSFSKFVFTALQKLGGVQNMFNKHLLKTILKITIRGREDGICAPILQSKKLTGGEIRALERQLRFMTTLSVSTSSPQRQSQTTLWSEGENMVYCLAFPQTLNVF